MFFCSYSKKTPPRTLLIRPHDTGLQVFTAALKMFGIEAPVDVGDIRLRFVIKSKSQFICPTCRPKSEYSRPRQECGEHCFLRPIPTDVRPVLTRCPRDHFENVVLQICTLPLDLERNISRIRVCLVRVCACFYVWFIFICSLVIFFFLFRFFKFFLKDVMEIVFYVTIEMLAAADYTL